MRKNYQRSFGLALVDSSDFDCFLLCISRMNATTPRAAAARSSQSQMLGLFFMSDVCEEESAASSSAFAVTAFAFVGATAVAGVVGAVVVILLPSKKRLNLQKSFV